jgi:translation initiation factor IF-2
VIIEAQLDKSKGPIAHVLIQNGTLSVGDNVVVGKVWGRVKAMINDKGRRIRAAEPSTPVELLGLTALPEVGDSLVAVEDEKTAKAMVSEQQQSQMAHGLALEDVATRVKSGEIRELPIVLKCDVQGSVEAVRNALSGIKPGEVQLKLVHSGAGTITESDVLLATASKGIIVGFTTRVEPGAQRLADQQGVQIRLYNIIYNLVEEIEQALKGMAAPTVRELVEGRALVKMIFPTGKRGKAAGCQVLDGRIRRGANVRVMRKDKPVFQGSVASLRHFRDEVREVQAGTECGITLDGFSEYEEGDTLVAFQVVRG